MLDVNLLDLSIKEVKGDSIVVILPNGDLHECLKDDLYCVLDCDDDGLIPTKDYFITFNKTQILQLKKDGKI